MHEKGKGTSKKMKDIHLTRDYLNSNKILFHIGKHLEGIVKGQSDFGPIAIEIHPTAKCNHKCIHCSYKKRNEGRVSISQDVMKNLIDSIITLGVRAVYFSGGGEPSMYPGLSGYIEKLHTNHVEVSMITNGSIFEKMGLIEVADKLNYIAVSVPAVDGDTFEEITGTRNLEKVLRLPRAIKEIHGENSPVVGSRIILTNRNYSKVREFLITIKEYGFDYALFKIVRDYEDNGQGLTIEEENYLKREIENLWDVDDSFTNIKSVFSYRKPVPPVNRCWINSLGLLANINTDGKVYPNVVEIDQPEFCIGDLNTQSLEKIWNSERHQDVKRHSNEKWLSSKCKNCRAISYNIIINEIMDRIPCYYDAFI